MKRTLALLMALASLAHAVPDDELRQPRYASAHPGYAVVTFGVDKPSRVWLVVDGDVAFVDRDGNGDLTEAAERVAPNDRGEFVTDVVGAKPEGGKGQFRLRMSVTRDVSGEIGIKYLSVNPVHDIQGFHSTAGFIPLGSCPADAPEIPIDGPLRFALMDHWTGSTKCRVLPREGGEHEFSILVATPVRRTKAEAYVYPNLYPLVGERLPTIRAVFTPREHGSKSHKPLLRVWQCECARRYRCALAVPPAAVTSQATLFVSFPDWPGGSLKPAAFQLEYGDAADRVEGVGGPAQRGAGR